ncbi:phage tail protein [Delftia sp. HK171]|uniref:phage tail protein n=1 Tax=Delftia TaxID=80865 RepID=UPI00090433B2|nr:MULTISPECIES: tail fiber protein [Delftia]APE50472.1 phage tail protein [Delftia sp. HK171]MCG3782447.1 tail fiber protein [Delftia acidovorans]QPR34784.1 phage tail protein [Delftia acidovorans]
MSDPFVAEIRLGGFNFAPKGWAFCDGQLLPLSQNTALFSLLGTAYGGDGKSNFALPDLQGRMPMHPGQGPGLSLRDLGESGGVETVTLQASEIPVHSHLARAGTPADPAVASPAGAVLGTAPTRPYIAPASNTSAVTMAPPQPAGGSQPHNNLPPYLVMNFIIALQGIFPARS